MLDLVPRLLFFPLVKSLRGTITIKLTSMQQVRINFDQGFFPMTNSNDDNLNINYFLLSNSCDKPVF